LRRAAIEGAESGVPSQFLAGLPFRSCCYYGDLKTSTDIGNELERAVHLIERAILDSSPGLAKDSFRIEGKKIVTVDGVRHEIDLWVEIDHGRDYRSIFIFECKNWKHKVGKNEIIIFSEKIDVLQAQKGFFVAPEFTSGAEAQATRDGRIQLLNVTDYPPEEMICTAPVQCEIRNGTIKALFVVTEEYLLSEVNAKRADPKSKDCSLNGVAINLYDYLQSWVVECAEDRQESFDAQSCEEGVYELHGIGCRNFSKTPLIVGGVNVKQIDVKVKFKVQVARPAIMSDYEVKFRGRVISFAPIVTEQGQYHTTIVMTGSMSE
jgi:hypothetical protein